MGSNLAGFVPKQGNYDVVVINDLSTGPKRSLVGLDVDFVDGGILDENLLDTAIRGGSVIHLGAIQSIPRSIKNPVAFLESNGAGTLTVLASARKNEVKHIIVASSNSVYGSIPRLRKKKFEWTKPMYPYAVSNHATEGYSLAYSYAHGMKTLAFRFINVYGLGRSAGNAYAAVISQFIDAALSGRALPLDGDGTRSRSITYADSLREALLISAERKLCSSDPVNLASRTNVKLLASIVSIEENLGVKLEIEYKPERIGDIIASQADSALIGKRLPSIETWSIGGFKPWQ